MRILSLLFIFIIGLAAGMLIASAKPAQADWQDGDYDGGIGTQFAAAFQPIKPQESPMDRVPEKAIEVYKDRIILDIQDAQWATFTDTHSMEPILFKGANAIEIVPKSIDDVKVGDIVSYRSEYADGSIIHRVVYKGEDEQGTYFIMKGDNLPTSDPGRIRFNQIQRVVIAIVY